MHQPSFKQNAPSLPSVRAYWRGLTADAADLKKRKKTVHFGRIQAMSLPGRFKLDDSASNELVGVKFYDFFFDRKIKIESRS